VKARNIVALACFAALAGSAMPQLAAAQSGGRALLAEAITNTNRAHSYVESDVNSEMTGRDTIVVTSREAYDETHNRESDHATFQVRRPGSAGAAARLQYSIDIVMTDGHTFYRSSRTPKTWHVQPGMGYTDPVSGQRWIRSSLRFTYLNAMPLAWQGPDKGNLWHYRFRAPIQAPARGHGFIDVWVSAVGNPHIVRYVQSADFTTHSAHFAVRSTSLLQNFNQPMHITVPRVGTI
jgi:hypothetical protein